MFGMASSSGVFVIVVGIIIHVLYLSSVFYIYFKSPILHDLKSINVNDVSPAKRLVLFVTDGLQAEKAFHRENKKTKFLRNIIKTGGRWGVSHTRVPTESRVGHVSLIAGTYEDVSAITNGWKVNPVEFDSFFNQSYKTWCWGSPDILNIFDKNEHDNIKAFSYKSDDIDFASTDPSKLDTWVFEEVQKFFQLAKDNKELFEEVNHEKIVFFLHLLGLDTNGHSKKPDSQEYLNNIGVVDEGIKKVTEIFNEYYKDNKTVFIVTSDHGMTPWGAHGTGLASETETPFIAWGSGVKHPVKKRNINTDRQSMIWGFEDFLRTDVNQVDIAPLMSFLLGVSFPANSVGVLPHEVLDVEEKTKAQGLFHNMLQIKEQYDAHKLKVQQSRFQFTSFGESNQDIEREILGIQKEFDLQNYEEAINKSEECIEKILRGIQYYHTYNRFSLSLCVNVAFALWLLLLILKAFDDHTNISLNHYTQRRRNWVTKTLTSKLFVYIYTVAVAVIGFVLYVQSKDPSYVMYSLLPFVMLRILLPKIDFLWILLCYLVGDLSKEKFHFGFVCNLMLVFCGIEILVMAFFNRGVLSIIGVVLSITPWLRIISENMYNNKLKLLQKAMCCLFTIASLILSIFPQLAVIQSDHHYLLVLIGGFIIATVGLIYSFILKTKNSLVISIQTVQLVICIVVKMHSVQSINDGHGLPRFNQLFSWISLMFFPLLVTFVDSRSPARLLSFVLSLSAIYTLTSISYELLFLVALTLQLTSWALVEVFVFSELQSKQSSKSRGSFEERIMLTTDHLRLAFMFVYFIFMSFFGTGNIASINSFNIESAYCFQTIFNPWVQGVVLATKVLVPFLLVIVMFRSMQSLTSLPMRGIFLVILILTDVMAIHFFYLVRDEGSWLDIGQSLSHFIIALVFVIFLVPVYELSYFISGSVSLKRSKEHTP